MWPWLPAASARRRSWPTSASCSALADTAANRCGGRRGKSPSSTAFARRDLAAGVDDFRAAGAEVHLASDDGSLGEHGFVTQLLERHGPPDHLFGCGPEPMLHALAALAKRWGVPCHVSLETPMACGVGICFSCVTKVKTPEGWDYRRSCVEGPVFDAAELEW